MSINLNKGSSINLSKDNAGLKNVFIGLGWDPAKKKKGFFGGLLNSGVEDSIDLDASAILFNSKKEIVDIVWFRNLKSRDGSVVHSGDNRTGGGDGDDEVINVDFSRMSADVQAVVFVVSSFRGQTFNEVDQAFCRIVNQVGSKEMAKYVLSGGGNYTGYLMTKLYKEAGAWHMQAIGEPANGRTVEDFTESAKKYL